MEDDAGSRWSLVCMNVSIREIFLEYKRKDDRSGESESISG